MGRRSEGFLAGSGLVLCPPPTIPCMSATIDVCIRGAGIVGRTLACCWRANALQVGLVSRPRPARRR